MEIHVQGVQLQTLLKSGLQVCCITLPGAEDGHYCELAPTNLPLRLPLFHCFYVNAIQQQPAMNRQTLVCIKKEIMYNN